MTAKCGLWAVLCVGGLSGAARGVVPHNTPAPVISAPEGIVAPSAVAPAIAVVPVAQAPLIQSEIAPLAVPTVGPMAMPAAAAASSVESGGAPSPTADDDRLRLTFDGQTAAPSDDAAYSREIPAEAARAIPGVRPGSRLMAPIPTGREAESLAWLSESLGIMGLPPYKEAVVAPPAVESQPPVVYASLPSIWKLAVMRHGGRKDPGNVLMAMDSSWFLQELGADGRNRLFLTKGLTFEKDGLTPVLVTYTKPRLLGYYQNLLTLGAFERDDGVPLERNLDHPMSSSSQLEQETNDKLMTRLLLAAADINVPATRAFLMPDHRFLSRDRIPGTPRVRAQALPEKRAAVRRAVVEFLKHYRGPEVVVKPSGAKFHSGHGVRYFPRESVDAIADYVTALSKDPLMESNGSVLLEQRLAPPPVYLRLGPYSGAGHFAYMDKKQFGVTVLQPWELGTAAAHEKKDYNERVWVVRTRDDGAFTVPLTFFRANAWGTPTSAQPKNPELAAAVVDQRAMIDAWRRQHGLLQSAEEVAALDRQRDELGRKALLAVIANESHRVRRDGEPYQAQTDMIGLDVMYQAENGRLVMYVIEVNDHDSAGQHVMDLYYPERIGEHSDVLLDTQLHRARKAAGLSR